MESFFWQLANRTAETEFIFNLFHSLLAGLTLSVLLRQLRANRLVAAQPSGRLPSLSFFLLVVHFGLLSLDVGARFFFGKKLQWAGFEPFSRGLMACAMVVLVAGYLQRTRGRQKRFARWTLRLGAAVLALVLADLSLLTLRLLSSATLNAVAIQVTDLLALAAVGIGMSVVLQLEKEARKADVVALVSVAAALIAHNALPFLTQRTGILVWNGEQHVLSIALFSFAWAAGERSRNLLDRVFVRLNLTFILLASLIMLITAGTEKYRYLRLAEERSMDLAEFLRGHIVYYQSHGDRLENILGHAEVLRRVVMEFGRLPELREVSVYLNGELATFDYSPDWVIEEQILTGVTPQLPGVDSNPANSFQMILLPIERGPNRDNWIRLVGTMDYINEYIGRYLILIYVLFTVMVALATCVIGIIVWDTDRRLQQQYAELQETHTQLAQAAKLASIGQLAGGMAHEINTPITSILALASHLTEEEANAMPARQRQSLQIIAQQARRVSKIVGNLLAFSRQSHMQLSRVDLGRLLETAVTLVQYRSAEGAIQFRREIDGNLPQIVGDADRLTEVFVNLLNNAIDAMPAGGTLVVRASSTTELNSVRVEVVDTGHGIRGEELPRIFDPFFTTKEPGRGTGLGLSVSHGIVKDHGGQIWVESTPGAGTTFIVTLPKEVHRDGSAYPGSR